MLHDTTINVAQWDAVLFDLDGTLLDSFGSIGDLTDAALREAGHLPCDRDILRRLIGLPLEAVFQQIWPTVPDAMTVARAIATYRAQQLQDASPRFFAGVSELLTDLRVHGVRIAIVTTKGTPAATRALTDGGMIGHVEVVIGGDIVPHLKPHPAPAHMALQRLGIGAHRAVVVGDTTHDIHMAVAAGCPAVGVTWGAHDAATLRSAGAVSVVSEMRALRDALLVSHGLG